MAANTDAALVLNTISALTTEASAEEATEILNLAAQFKEQAAKIEKVAKERLLEWLVQNGDLTIGDIRWYAGSEKVVKEGDKSTTVWSVIGRAMKQGTRAEDALAELLSSDPWKHGALKDYLGEKTYGELFTVSRKPDLKTGKAKKVIKRIDTRYSKEVEE